MSSSSSDSDEENRDVNIHRRRRRFRPKINFFINDAESFRERFRFTQNGAESLLRRIAPLLEHDTMRNYALSPRDQLLIALSFFASGSFYYKVGDAHGPSKSTVCRAVRCVVEAVNSVLFANVVQWPETADDRQSIATRFFAIARMPAVCGAIDGTLIRIEAPSENEPQFVDRHGDHSLNALMVSGPEFQFYYCCANWPGSVNDPRILRSCSLGQRLEEGWRVFPHAILLGDSIFALRDYLIPPISSANETENERRFNRSHKQTRRIVESAYGILKNRFPCLRHLRVKDPKYAGQIINCCVTLHNLCLAERPVQQEELQELGVQQYGLEEEAETEPEDNEQENDGNLTGRAAGLQRLRQLLHHFRN